MKKTLRALDSNGSAPASHLGSGSRSMRRLPTMGLIDRSDGCQMSCSIVGCPGVAFRTTGVAAHRSELVTERPNALLRVSHMSTMMCVQERLTSCRAFIGTGSSKERT